MATQSIPPIFAAEAESLKQLRGRERARRRKELEQLFQVSRSTMSRWLHAARVISHSRRDKGKRRVDEEVLKKVFAIQYSSYKQTQGPLLPAEDAIEIAERNGKIPAGVLTPSTYNTWLRANGAGRAEIDVPEPHVDLISLGPNHVHQADFSLAVNWKIENNKAVYEELVYKNKLPEAGTPRLWRLIVTDHTSGMFFVWYTVSTGESAMALIEGLWAAWTEKTCEGRPITGLYPFRGVPRILMLDRGPGNKSDYLANFLEPLGVKRHICKDARSKGQVEGRHWWWEQRFEGRFRLDPVIDVQRLKDEANSFVAKLCKTHVHRRLDSPSTAHWEFHINRGWESQLRVPNCDWPVAQSFAVGKPHIARVGNSGIVQFKRERYRLPEPLMRERKVSVQYSPFDYPSLYVRALDDPDTHYVCEPLEFDQHGFPVDGVVIGEEYRKHEHGRRARMISGAEQKLRDEGIDIGKGKYLQKKAKGPQEKYVTRGYHLEGLEASGIKSAEEPIDLAGEERVYTKIQAREEVIARIGRPVEPAERRVLQSFGDVVTEDEVAAAVAAIEEGVKADIIPMVAG